MILRTADAFKLAYTKLRTRKVRTVVTLFVSGLLFSVLVAGSMIVSGALQSFDDFSSEGFTKRYIVAGAYSVFQYNPEDDIHNDAAYVARAEALVKDEVAAKKAAAKRLNLPYDETALMKETIEEQQGVKRVNSQSKIGLQAYAELQSQQNRSITMDKFKKQIGDNAAIYYSALQRSMIRPDAPKLTLIQNGKEDIDSTRSHMSTGFSAYSSEMGLSAMTGEWGLMDEGLLEPFLLKDQTLEVGGDGSIPIIASYSAAQQILKLPQLAKDAQAVAKKERLEAVRSGISGSVFEVCYRNYASSQLLQSAAQQQADIKANATNKNYQKPDLIHSPSATPCAEPIVERDVRTSAEKSYYQRQEQFDKEFGAEDPKSSLLKFRIVGVVPDAPFSGQPNALSGITNMLSMMLTSSIGVKWVSPLSVLKSSSEAQDVFKKIPAPGFMGNQELFFAEYATADAARTALKQKSCRVDFGDFGQVDESTKHLPVCSDDKAPFGLQSFGAASLAIEDVKTGFRKVQLWAALIVGGIAAVILMGMIGRIIADARKETAIFRATGASRFAVAQIYFTYTLCLVVLMLILVLALGFGVALWVESQLSVDTGINAALMFNVNDLSKTFHFYSFEPYDLGIISAAILGASLLGSAVPILRSMQRNPIRDMREE